MKRFISILIAFITVAASVFSFAFSISADDVIPSGQIWEGEELMRYYTGNDPLVVPYGQNIGAYDDPEKGIYASKMSHFAWKPTVIGDSLSFELDVKTQGEKDFMIKVTKASDYGILGVFWDDVQIGQDIDLYSATVAFETVNLGKYTVFPGKHVLTFKLMGGNPEKIKDFYFIGVDYFEMIGSDGKSRAITAASEGENYGIITKYEDGTIRYEGESIKVSEESISSFGWIEGVDYRTQNYYKNYCTLSFGWQFLFQASYGGCEIGLEFNVEEAGEYSTAIAYATAAQFGIGDIYIDGQLVASGVDMYNSPKYFTEYTKGNNVMLDEGKHTITLKAVDSNELSTSYIISLDYLEIKKVGEYSEPTVTTTEMVEQTTTEAPADNTTKAPENDTTTKTTDNNTTKAPTDKVDTTVKTPDNTTKSPDGADDDGCGGFSLGTFGLALMSVISFAAISLIKKK